MDRCGRTADFTVFRGVQSIRLADPCGLLQGDGVSKRFVPIGTVADAERTEVTALIREAAALDPAAWA
jgi:hypothetical protein